MGVALVAAGISCCPFNCCGLLLAISSAISRFIKRCFSSKYFEKDELMASRLAMAASIAAAGYFGFNPPDFAAGTVALAFGLAASSIFPVLMMEFFQK